MIRKEHNIGFEDIHNIIHEEQHVQKLDYSQVLRNFTESFQIKQKKRKKKS